ncbi:response regulator [Leptolyngbya ohadii]|uniref:response regulator n=1 Tax=Leptolyngbya ohadii TaxID=1962290 RepID=UPI000B59E1AD|nr:response regulator [Leptolyngbya ohadii]
MKHHPGQVDATGKALPDGETPLAGVQVLLVEDEFDIATLLLFILLEAGAEAVWVVQSREALDCLDHFHPDILLSNIKLPDHDGDWLIQEIRQAESVEMPRLPAIAITSYTRDVAATQVLEAGFDRFMPKHFDPEEIISTILDLV